eukprot:TRINITY_DN84133_c0_g1_i1.p1 TRINITY_DN84133_c0_g1~~TRINITY_DN84133_c0_g1_i1.p1  ORF type:complete len:487 (+),score=61.54 TRINITY_DN84133_c0_g1_i1:70-1461(+)
MAYLVSPSRSRSRSPACRRGVARPTAAPGITKQLGLPAELRHASIDRARIEKEARLRRSAASREKICAFWRELDGNPELKLRCDTLDRDETEDNPAAFLLQRCITEFCRARTIGDVRLFAESFVTQFFYEYDAGALDLPQLCTGTLLKDVKDRLTDAEIKKRWLRYIQKTHRGTAEGDPKVLPAAFIHHFLDALDTGFDELDDDDSVPEMTQKTRELAERLCSEAGMEFTGVGQVEDDQDCASSGALGATPESALTFSKTLLNEFCQKHCGKDIARADYSYTTTEVAVGKHQCTLRLHCFDDLEFMGEARLNAKSAERAAAQRALDYLEGNVASLSPKQGSTSRKSAKENGNNGPAASDPKTSLNWFLQKYCRKVIRKEDFSYKTVTVQALGGHQSTVQLHCIDDMKFMGETCTRKLDAERSAAQQALNHFADVIAMLHQADKESTLGIASKKRKVAEEAVEA